MAAGRLVIPQWMPARDRNGRLVPGAELTVYTNGTTTKATIYSDEALTTVRANPVVANGSGVFPEIWAEAGTVATPTRYRVGINGPDGSSITNPDVLDNWQPSVDGETAASALAEAAKVSAEADAAAAQSYYEDIVALQGIADDAIALATRAAKAANGSDFTDAAAVRANIGAADRDFSEVTQPATARGNLGFPSIKTNIASGNIVYGSLGASMADTAAGTKNGDINTGFGLNVLQSATSAYACAAFGYGALNAATTGHSNTGLGYQAGLGITTGIMNTLVGVDAAYQSTALNYCVVVGHHCLNSANFAGEGAIVIGQQTARSLTSGNYINAIGRNAMANSPATGSADCEVIGGAAAIAASVNASTIIGKDSVAVTGAISNSVIVGKSAQYGGGTISANAIIGVETFFRATGGGGNNNTSLGYQTGYSVAGDGNVLLGYRAGYRSANTTVNSAVCIGNLAGFDAVASGDLYIGNSDALAAHLIWGNFGTQVLNLRANSLRLKDIPTYADNAAAVAAGAATDQVYKTATGELRIVV